MTTPTCLAPSPFRGPCPAWLTFLHGQLQEPGLECCFCSQLATDVCHLEHGRRNRDDWLVYVGCRSCHTQVDHGPRATGETGALREGVVRKQLALWFTYDLPRLRQAFLQDLEDWQAALAPQVAAAGQKLMMDRGPSGPREPW